MAYGVAWDGLLVMGNTIGWVRVFENLSALQHWIFTIYWI